MGNTAIKLSSDLRIENIVVVDGFMLEGYQLVDFPVCMGQLFSEAKHSHLSYQARTERDRLLAASDWMALSDVTMSPAWAAYRQELRDITTQAGFPDNIVWPKEPVA